MGHEALKQKKWYRALRVIYVLAFLVAEAIGLYLTYRPFLPPACVHAHPPCAVPQIIFSTKTIVARLAETAGVIILVFGLIKVMFIFPISNLAKSKQTLRS